MASLPIVKSGFLFFGRGNSSETTVGIMVGFLSVDRPNFVSNCPMSRMRAPGLGPIVMPYWFVAAAVVPLPIFMLDFCAVVGGGIIIYSIAVAVLLYKLNDVIVGDCGLVMFFVQKLVDVGVCTTGRLMCQVVNPFFLCSSFCQKKCEKACNS